MTPLLEQFLSESRDFLQNIGKKLMELEQAPDDNALMNELFRFVHTLKGNSGLFEFPEMTRVLHAAEDLMDAVRNNRVVYSQTLADHLLDAMDFVSMLCDEVQTEELVGSQYAAESARIAESLRYLLASKNSNEANVIFEEQIAPITNKGEPLEYDLPLGCIPEEIRINLFRKAAMGAQLFWLHYKPSAECFFSGEDPLHLVHTAPNTVWGSIFTPLPWPKLAELDAYRCTLEFYLLCEGNEALLVEHFRYVPDQIKLTAIPSFALITPRGDLSDDPIDEDFVEEALRLLASDDIDKLIYAAQTLLELSNPNLWRASALRWLILLLECDPTNHAAHTLIIQSLKDFQAIDWRKLNMSKPSAEVSVRPSEAKGSLQSVASVLSDSDLSALKAVLKTQREILDLPIEDNWHLGRLSAASSAISGCLAALGNNSLQASLAVATQTSLDSSTAAPLRDWFELSLTALLLNDPSNNIDSFVSSQNEFIQPNNEIKASEHILLAVEDSEPKFGRRAEDTLIGNKNLKVDQVKIDRLMNLIGEIVVAKNGLPYLAGRAENVFGVRDLSREIKAQYAVINRIAEEMQDAIMQIRMMPVSFVFQRFPRLVRDLSRKLGKEVNLVLKGEDTEADKNIIEALADPLVHIVRNSLDHGFEAPEVRLASGKSRCGTLTISAIQESDRVIIEIVDDGKGIDPIIVKQKAYSKGLIDEASMERMSDQEAINLVFAAGFSTAEVVSDLSGRGVGMDVVRTAINQANGTISLDSVLGKGTSLRLALPLSMAVTNVMIVESSNQTFGVPMDNVVETVRIPRSAIRTIKSSLATVLRGKIVPLKAMNSLLGINLPPKANNQDELAVLVVRFGEDVIGLLVDEFHETVDIILKPLNGVLHGLLAYSGSALMGDGSVLLVLNIKELI